MTEDEAKTKWCPHVRISDCGADNSVASNRNMMDGAGYCCIASDCMMWSLDYKRMPVVTINGSAAEMDTDEVIGGHCGLTK